MKLYTKVVSVFFALIAFILSLYTSYACFAYTPNSVYYFNSLNDTNPDVVYNVVYPLDSYVPAVPITGAGGRPLKLVNNKSAVYPTRRQLMFFVRWDDTYALTYNYSTFICGDAAEQVHNRAEAKGIRCGIVRIVFAGFLTRGHVINVFKLSDGNYMFVDSTPAIHPPTRPKFLAVSSLYHNETMNKQLTSWFNTYMDKEIDNNVTDYHVYW